MENKQIQEFMEWEHKKKEKHIKLVFMALGFFALLILFNILLVPFFDWIIGFSCCIVILMIIWLCVAFSNDRKTQKALAINIHLQMEKIVKEEAKSVPNLEVESYGGSIPFSDVKWISACEYNYNGWGLIRAKYRGIPVEFCNVEFRDTNPENTTTKIVDYDGLVIKLTCSRFFTEWIKIINNDFDNFPELSKKEKRKQIRPDNHILRNEYTVLTSSEEDTRNYLTPLIMETIIRINKKADSAIMYFNENAVYIALWNYRFVFTWDSFEQFGERCRKDFKEIAELMDMVIDRFDCFGISVG